MAFLSSFLTYLITAVILAVISFCGVKAGIALRKKKNAKEALETAEETRE
ncbi:MAG: hypothetical protein IIZ61_06155 [Lachnospiraceae bacterium]|nr:hypothetical protein [Lachnospiraceae bacterium]